MKWLLVVTSWTLAIGLLAAPAAADAQTRQFRIGVLGNQDNPPWEGLRQRLRELGYVDGGNTRFDWRWSDGFPERLPALARELVALKPDLIVTSGSLATLAARDATTTIPIVMALSQQPERLGLVQSLARPGGNITGMSTHAPQLMAKKLQLLKEVAPTASRVAFLWNPASQAELFGLQEVLAAAPAAGVTILPIELRSPDEVQAALAAVTASGANALMAFGSPVTFKARQHIADFALKRRLPGIFEERLFAEAGCLMSYAPSFWDLYRRTAVYVDRILKGAKPADLPVEQPTTFELVVNLKTAAALGLTIPQAVLLRADKVID